MTYKRSKSYPDVLSSKILTKFSSESDLCLLEVSDKKLGSFQNEKTKAKENITLENVQCLQYDKVRRASAVSFMSVRSINVYVRSHRKIFLLINLTMAMGVVIFTHTHVLLLNN